MDSEAVPSEVFYLWIKDLWTQCF